MVGAAVKAGPRSFVDPV